MIIDIYYGSLRSRGKRKIVLVGLSPKAYYYNYSVNVIAIYILCQKNKIDFFKKGLKKSVLQ